MMLRYYDEMNLLNPAKIDECSGYRLYSIWQIPTLNKIVFLRDLGFGISEISDAINDWNNHSIANRLQEKYLEIQNNIKLEQDKLKKIKLAQTDIQSENIEIHYNVLTKSVSSYKVLSYRKIIPDYYAEGQMWKEMTHFAMKNNVKVSNNTFSIYHDEEYKEENVDVELCALVDDFNDNIVQHAENFRFRNTESVPIMAYTMVYGDFLNIKDAYLSFANWLQQHNVYEMKGQSRQIVHKGPWNEQNPDNYLIEIQIPLEKV